MGAKATFHPLAVRFSGEEREFLKRFQGHLSHTTPGAHVTLSDAVKVLVEAGRKVLQPSTNPDAFLEALRALDPTWTGRKPELRDPVDVQTRSGRSPVELVLARRKNLS